MALEDYFLDEEKLNDGCVMQLADIHGRPTDDWIRVLFMYSERVQKAVTDEYRRRFNLENVDAEKIREEIEDTDSVERTIRHHLVSDWSFDAECTPENVKELLRRNPQIAQRIVSRAENQRFFLPDAGKNSSTGQGGKSNSAKRTKGPKAVAA